MYLVRGSAEGWRAPVALRDRAGGELVLGMHWDFEAKRWRNPEGVPFGDLHAVSIAVVDWDGDLDTDLVAGTADGKVFRWTNLGTPAQTAFAEHAEPVVAGGKPLEVRAGHAMPTIADWDQDGLWDLVLGGDDGEVSWARNVGRKGAPAFAAPATLVPTADDSPGRSGRSALVEVADLNGDGDVDLLVGEHEDEEVPDGRTPEQVARYAAVQRELEACADVRKVLGGDDEAAKQALGAERVAAYQALLKELRELGPKHRSLNRVWFYPRARAPGGARP